MAKVSSYESKGHTYYRLSVKVKGNWKRVGLGTDVKRDAQRKLERVADSLEAAHEYGTAVDRRTLEELSELSSDVREKLEATGLVKLADIPTLGNFITAYIKSHGPTVSEYTVNKLERSAGNLTEFFGEDCELASVTEGDAVEYVKHRTADGLAPSTVGTEVKHAKQFFKHAVRKGYLDRNPWDGVKATLTSSDTQPVPAETLAKVEAALSGDWQLLFAVCRWSGCRRGEALELRWEDVLWDAPNGGQVRITSPKTERYGKAQRTIPLFPELRTVLEAHKPKDATGYVLPISFVPEDKRRGMGQRNLAKLLTDQLRRIGVEPWANPFKALRVTRENELVRDGFAANVIQDWMGHTRKVAEKHYLKTVDDDFKRATATPDDATERRESDPTRQAVRMLPGQIKPVTRQHGMQFATDSPRIAKHGAARRLPQS